MYKLIIEILVIAGAINWGLLTLQNIDIVKVLFGSGQLERYIKLAIGAAGLYYAYLIYNEESIEDFMTAESLKKLIKNKKEKLTNEEDIPNSIPATLKDGVYSCPENYPSLVGKECYPM